MFLDTKHFLVFLSFSMLPPICAMNNNDKNNWAPFLPIFPSLRPHYEFYSSHYSKFLVPKNNPEEEKKQLKNIKSLLQDADPKFFKIGPLKKSIMSAAVEHNDVELLELLLKSGVDINTCNNGSTALCQSIAESNDFLREYLLQKGADPNTVSDYNMTSLGRAMLKEDVSAIKSLIKYSANVDVHKANKLVGNAYANFNLKKEYYPYIKTVLLVLRRICNRTLYDNENSRFLILSCLPEYHCHPGLYKELQNRKYALKPFTLHVVDGHTKIVQDILKVKNRDNKDILELFPSITSLNEKLLSDTAEFKENYLDMSAIKKGNLAFEVLKRYALEYGYNSLIPQDIVAENNIYNTPRNRADNGSIVTLDGD